MINNNSKFILSRKGVYLIPFIVFVVILSADFIGVLILNHGLFLYTLDDPYIHLALADHIRQGHYGLNFGEYSSPSSSIAWPYILALFSGFSWKEYIPFILNIVTAAATVMLFSKILLHIFSSPNKQLYGFMAAVASAMIPSLNIVGLVFTGMEHSLQTLLAVLSVYGLILLNDSSRSPRWLPFVLIAAPLIRYEAIAISLGGILIFFFHKRYLLAMAICITIILEVVGFSAYLHSLGLPMLPASVIAKTTTSDNFLFSVLQSLYGNLHRSGSWTLLICLILIFYGIYTSAKTSFERRTGWALVISVCLCLIFGRFGWYYRYEIAILSIAIIGLLYIYKSRLHNTILSLYASHSKLLMVYFILGIAIFIRYWSTLFTVPLASNNIYEQQYQMSRFFTEYYREPIAVNDIGICTYHSDGRYVLDLWGLSSPDALKARLSRADPIWMDSLVRKHSIHLAMVYTSWFDKLPATWQPLAYLKLYHNRISAAESQVTFYALDEEGSRTLPDLLLKFRKSLPAGVVLDIIKEKE